MQEKKARPRLAPNGGGYHWGVDLASLGGGGQYLGTWKASRKWERKNHFLLFSPGLRSQWFLLSAVGGGRMAAWLWGGLLTWVSIVWYLESTDGIVVVLPLRLAIQSKPCQSIT